MNYQLKKETNIPAYMQLYDFLREDIVQGVYPFGSKLPSKRLIAEETGVSVITVQHAIYMLCEEGYVEAKERSGYFVIYREADFGEVPGGFGKGGGLERRGSYAGEQEEHIGHREASHAAHIASNGALSFHLLSKTMRKVLLDYGDQILEPSPHLGCIALRKEICAYLARSRGMEVKPEQVVIGSGAEYLYSLIAQLFERESLIAVENPCYEKIEKVYKASGHPVQKLTMGKDGIVSEELRACEASVLHVTPFHSFPSGVSANISKKREYLQWAKEKGYLIEDNYDSELTVLQKQEDTLFGLSKGEKVIYINTFSKTIAPSLRAGYMILPESLVERYEIKLGFYSCSVPVYEQYVLAELLQSGEFERHINRIRRKLRKNRP